MEKSPKRFYYLSATNSRYGMIEVDDSTFFEYDDEYAMRSAVMGMMCALSVRYKGNIKVSAIECDANGNRIGKTLWEITKAYYNETLKEK